MSMFTVAEKTVLAAIKAAARKRVASQKAQEKGITSIKKNFYDLPETESEAGQIVATFQDAGLWPLDKAAKFIKDEKDVIKYLNIIESINTQRLRQKTFASELGKSLKKEGDVIQFPKDKITNWEKPRPTTEKNIKSKLEKQNKEAIERLKNKKLDRDKKAGGGPAGLSYLLAEDSNERMPLAGGGAGKPPVSFYFNMQGGAGKKTEDFLGIQGLTEKGYDYGGTLAADTTFPFLGGDLSVGGELGFGRDKSNVDYKGQPIDFLSNVGETKLGDNWNVGVKWRKKFAAGGMGRRAFLKLMAALGATGVAAKSGLGSLFKAGKPIAKELTQVPIKNIEGMPAWFKPLVNKIIKEGKEEKITEYERLITHTTKLPDSKTPISVSQDLNTGDVIVDIGRDKHGFPDGHFGQPVRLEYKASEVIAPDLKTGKGGGKIKEEFTVEEAEFTGGHPENVKFEESTIEKFGDHGSNFDEVEMFATGKVKKSKPTKKRSQTEYEQDKAQADAEAYWEEHGDFANGGLAKMLGE